MKSSFYLARADYEPFEWTSISYFDVLHTKQPAHVQAVCCSDQPILLLKNRQRIKIISRITIRITTYMQFSIPALK